MTDWPPTRAAALTRLKDFAPQAAGAYARRRNLDLPGHPNVSRLSPWLRHRLITEAEVIAAIRDRHGPDTAAKFLSEVGWRLYFKGWLEQRPAVWTAYRADREAAWNEVQTQGGLRQRWEAACTGQTGIACFDHWAQELARTGYLHNHARMSFASIWIFTLGLPWTLGADFFLRHLLDGDPASNTLSWRWVGGLHSRGKTYLATPDAIAACTEGRFHPEGLAQHAHSLDGPPPPQPRPLPVSDRFDTQGRVGLLLTEDDLCPDDLLDRGLHPVATATLQATAGRSHLAVAEGVADFTTHCTADCTARLADRIGPVTACPDGAGIVRWAADNRLDRVMMHHAPVGPARDALGDLRDVLNARGIALSVQVRPIDALAWPHATAGYFRFRDVMTEVIARA
ncbi:deoxyribodipyrimidine photo-lyase [Loktanella atrilutea]|uniref:Deoxyribodipyrimidine photo-lyase n=1 Tax=Loktanella atrilutea TaxID=366533 RepID=A0A1M5B533_LOKAT|nr:FAD-binding domain-containing protein [Loktanella atrilutea]SHF37427.1 deoxyribodipyrimidine photo-lyase [Loktanella atrilutea]